MNIILKAKIVEHYGTQADFAQAIGVSESDVSRIVRGRRRLTEDKMEKWAELLQTSAKELFGSAVGLHHSENGRR